MRIAVDVCVGRAAGKPNSKSTLAIVCRDVLETFAKCGYHLVNNPRIEKRRKINEWKCLGKCFGLTWYGMMKRRGMVIEGPVPRLPDLLARVAKAATSGFATPDIRKDFHFIEGALVYDFRVISRDDKARNYFKVASREIAEICGIMWVPIETKAQEVIFWLEKGAPENNDFKLS